MSDFKLLLAKALKKIDQLELSLQEERTRKEEPIAVVGLSCRFPAGETPASFFHSLEQGKDAIREIPQERMLHPWPEGVPRWAGLLEDVSRFDASFFGISPREAQSLDPQQRLLLEVSWEALERACIVPESLKGARAGVFLGLCTLDYLQRVQRRPEEEHDAYGTTGNMFSTAAGRLSYSLGLQGPAVTLDTACSSSLVAIHLACQSLHSHESDLALAGGVNLILSEESTAALAKTQALSPDGRCRTFDANANGFVRGEGCGIVVLKRLSDALRQKDPILAIIRGSAINQDGRSTGLTAPNVLSQEALLREALQKAGVSPHEVSYLECHGTGTNLGDPIETDALKAVFGARRADHSKLWLGAVKTNIGHLEAAAGVAGFIKVVLALQQKRLPKNLHLRNLNPRLQLAGTPLVPLSENIPWSAIDGRRIAGVSSFGLSGTNAHVVLEEHIAEDAPPAKEGEAPLLFVLSGKTRAALQEQAKNLSAYLQQAPALSLIDVAYSLGATRTHFAHRAALLASHREGLLSGLSALSSGKGAPGVLEGVQADLSPEQQKSAEAALASFQSGAGDRARLLLLLGDFYLKGYAPDWSILFPSGRSIALPTYPFQRERFWIDALEAEKSVLSDAQHPLLGAPFSPATDPSAFFWERELSLRQAPFLKDHKIGEACLFPAAAYIEMILSAVREKEGESPILIEELALERALLLPENEPVLLQTVLRSEGPGRYSFQISSRSKETQAPWILHTRGQVRRDNTQRKNTPRTNLSEGAPSLPAAPFYQALAARGLGYGPAFRGLGELWLGDQEALARVSLPKEAGSLARYFWHPALLDACLHAFAAALGSLPKSSGPLVPVRIRRLWALQAGGEVLSHARALQRSGAIEGELSIVNPRGELLLAIEGLQVEPLARGDVAKQVKAQTLTVEWRQAPSAPKDSRIDRWVLLGDASLANETLLARLVTKGAKVTARHSLSEALDEVTNGDTPLGLICALGLQHPAPSLTATALHALRALAKRASPDLRLVFVTTRAQPIGLSVEAPLSLSQAPLYGLVRTAALEHPGLSVRCIDLDDPSIPEEMTALVDEILSGSSEEQVALRGTRRFVPRVLPAQISTQERQKAAPQKEQNYRVVLETPGRLDSLSLQATRRKRPAKGEVEIQVQAAGLNFLDVLSGLGALSLFGTQTPPPGGECAGVITAVGEGVELPVGLPVVAVTQGAFSRFVTADASLVRPYPAALHPQEAATLPIVYLTVYHSLAHIARLSRGEKVLIQSACGGVGLAALQVAKYLGAEVFATAGSEAKRDFLRGLGVRWVSDSRSERFVEDVFSWTNGEGVDVVLNSLSGPLLEKSFGLLREYGRFVDVGKRDYLANASLGLRPFLKNLSFSLVDLLGMIRSQPKRVGALLDEVLGLVAKGVLPPLPKEVFAAHRAEEAFRKMAQGQHVGKLVLDFEEAPNEINVTPAQAVLNLKQDATYLISGGLGGLGLSLGRWLSAQGAGRLILLGRGATSPAQEEALRQIQAAGAEVSVVQADVSDLGALRLALQPLEDTRRPLCGVIHAAGILEDSLLLDSSEESFARVAAPKAQGAWNLHTLTQGAALDFFVLFSSVASLFGSPGQANYAAANASLDALAHERRRLKLPALSINWGPFAEVGMAAREELQQRLRALGFAPMPPETAGEMLPSLLGAGLPQVAVLSLSEGASPILNKARPFFSELLVEAPAPEHTSKLLAALSEAPLERHPGLVQQHLQAELAKILRQPPESIPLGAPLPGLGFDSLMALELHNRLYADLGFRLEATAAFTHNTIVKLAAHICARLAGQKASAQEISQEELRAKAKLPAEIRPNWREAPPNPRRQILVTGGTGFVGAFLLSELLRAPLEADIIALTRAKDKAQAQERLRSTLKEYQLWEERFAERLEALPGDLERPFFGASEAAFSSLSQRCDTVVHCGALVNWILPFAALEASNVGGTREVLRFACQGRPKTLHYVSTFGTLPVYRALGEDAPGVRREAKLPTSLSAVGYFQTKWVAEQLVLQARQRGLNASIYRPGMVTGDSRTGVDSTSSGQFFFSLIKGCLQMRHAPDWSTSVRVVPVDYIARVVAKMAARGEAKAQDFNLLNTSSMPFPAIVETLQEMGYFLVSAPHAWWSEDVLSLPETAPENVLAPFGPFLSRALRADGSAPGLLQSDAELLSEEGKQLLEREGLFCPALDAALIRRYVNFYIESNALRAPLAEEEPKPSPARDAGSPQSQAAALSRARRAYGKDSPQVDLRPETLLETARSRTGLIDLGDSEILDLMARFLDSTQRDARLTLEGELWLGSFCVQHLSNQLRIQRLVKSHPEIVEIPIQRPLFIVGLPRTGTTALHQLLMRDPKNRAPLLWELLSPCPEPGETKDDPSRRVEEATLKVSDLHRRAPGLLSAHPLDAKQPDECQFLFDNELFSASFLQFGALSFGRWMLSQSPANIYRSYRRQLQILLWQRQGERLLLKWPFHLWFLDSLLEVFPDACIVQTHRDPARAIPSLCSLTAITQSRLNRRSFPAEIGRFWLEQCTLGIERMMKVRAGASESRFFDLHQQDLLRDPAKAIERLYAHFGLPLPGALNGKQSPGGAAKEHRYTPAQFGLKASQLHEQLAPYLTQFAVYDESK